MTNKEKLKKIKELADAMYTKMQNLTTDTSGIRKAMEEYHQFVIQEYYKEEPVEEDLEEASKYYALNNTPWDDCVNEIQESFKAGAKWQKEKEEPVSEDLGKYLYELSKQFPEVSFAKLSRIGVRVAKWQKEHLLKLSDSNDLSEPVSDSLEEAASRYAKEEYNKKNPSSLSDRCRGCYAPIMYAFKAGAKWKDKQMMSKAINFIIVDNNATSTEISTFPYVSLGTEGDTVKLIILKQD